MIKQTRDRKEYKQKKKERDGLEVGKYMEHTEQSKRDKEKGQKQTKQ